jgi:hypothetical protein
VKKYTTPTPGTMLDFYLKAQYTPAPGGMLEITGTNFVAPSDSVNFLVDEKTKKAHRFVFTTNMDGNPLTGTASYEQIPNGPLYAARMDIQVPANNMGALIETFNYQRGD